jgi:hypothetical protein
MVSENEMCFEKKKLGMGSQKKGSKAGKTTGSHPQTPTRLSEKTQDSNRISTRIYKNLENFWAREWEDGFDWA